MSPSSVQPSRPRASIAPSTIMNEELKRQQLEQAQSTAEESVEGVERKSAEGESFKPRCTPLWKAIPKLGETTAFRETNIEASTSKKVNAKFPTLPRLAGDIVANNAIKQANSDFKKRFIAPLEQRINTCLKAAATFTVLGACIYSLAQFVTIVPFLELQIACSIIIAVLCLVTAAFTFYQQKKLEGAIQLAPNTNNSTLELQITCSIIISTLCLLTTAFTFYQQKKLECPIPLAPNTSNNTLELQIACASLCLMTANFTFNKQKKLEGAIPLAANTSNSTLELQKACSIIMAVLCLMTAKFTFNKQKKLEDAILMPLEQPAPNTSNSDSSESKRLS